MADRELQPDQRAVRAADERREPRDAEVVEHGDHRVGLVGRVERHVERAVGADPVDRDHVVARPGRSGGRGRPARPTSPARGTAGWPRRGGRPRSRRARRPPAARVAEGLPAQHARGAGPTWRRPSVRSSSPRRAARSRSRRRQSPVRAAVRSVAVEVGSGSSRGGEVGRARADNVAGIMVSSGHGLPKERRGGGCRLARTSRPIFRWTRFRPRRTWHLATSYVSLVAPASTGLSLSRISMGFRVDRGERAGRLSTPFARALGGSVCSSLITPRYRCWTFLNHSRHAQAFRPRCATRSREHGASRPSKGRNMASPRRNVLPSVLAVVLAAATVTLVAPSATQAAQPGDAGRFDTWVGYDVGQYPQSAAMGDFNGDGSLDVAWGMDSWSPARSRSRSTSATARSRRRCRTRPATRPSTSPSPTSTATATWTSSAPTRATTSTRRTSTSSSTTAAASSRAPSLRPATTRRTSPWPTSTPTATSTS